jgi:hypothetical protein
MSEAQTASIAVRSDLMAEIERYAQTAHLTVDTVAEKALHQYLLCNPAANEVRQLHLERAESLGLEIEEYVALQMKEWRREDRELEANAAGRS